MTLVLMTSEEDIAQKKAKASKTLLDRYLSDSLDDMRSETRFKVGKIADDKITEAEAKIVQRKDVEAKQAEVNKELKKYGLKEQLYYQADGKAFEDILSDQGDHIMYGSLATIALTVAGAAMESPEIAVGGAASGVLYGATRATMRFLGKPRNEEKRNKMEEYTDLKHAQIALKKLKSAIVKYDKAEKREAYKTEVAQYMAMSNPGGFVSAPLVLAQKKKNGR